MKDLIKHRISHLSAGGKIITDETAKVGDILLSDNTWITSAAYAEHKDEIKAKPVGICGIPKGVLPDKKGRLVSADFMDYNNPEQGSKIPVTITWGDNVTEFSENMCTYNFWKADLNNDNNIIGIVASPSYYQDYSHKGMYESKVYPKHFGNQYGPPLSVAISSLQNPTKLNQKIFLEETTISGTSTTTQLRQSWETDFKLAQIDFDGQGNTDRIVAATTAETITDSSTQGNFPAANCCVAYKKGNRKWYLPAVGELLVIGQDFGKLIKSLNDLNDVVPLYVSYGFWTSSCCQSNSSSSKTATAFDVLPLSGHVGNYDRYSTDYVLAVSAF